MRPEEGCSDRSSWQDRLAGPTSALCGKPKLINYFIEHVPFAVAAENSLAADYVVMANTSPEGKSTLVRFGTKLRHSSILQSLEHQPNRHQW
jgi:hypothetical protein